jgi:2-polyprenyl-3-methyl-5-hydroxy-6-metoxy-1,4-benzoquinol methylase
MENELKKTGERVIVDEYSGSRSEFFIYQCHLATYQFAIPYVKNKKILEFGCGTGYGSNFLSNYCLDIKAVDISESAIEYAKNKYQNKNLSYNKIDDIEQEPLGFEDGTFDVVISFQVIEHIKNDKNYLSELSRVLKKGGVLILATPDKKYRLFPFQKPWNQFHIREYSMLALKDIVSKYFENYDGYHMSARADLIDMEIKRTKKLRMLSFPFTLFFIPEKIRIFIISFYKRLTRKNISNEGAKTEFNFDLNDIYIRKENTKSINLILVAIKSS